jgi:anti-sigma factor RsiW
MMNEREEETMSDLEPIYALMMDALDGELTAAQEQQLAISLAQHPALAREWRAMQAVDGLLSHAPLVVPAPSMALASRTVARLPNMRARRWTLAAVYTTLLLSGVMPVLAAVALIAFSAVSLPEIWQLMTVLGQALQQILLAMGNQLGQSPALLGTLLVMLGSISLWGGVYRQLAGEPAYS